MIYYFSSHILLKNILSIVTLNYIIKKHYITQTLSNNRMKCLFIRQYFF